MLKTNENHLISELKAVIEQSKTQINDSRFIHCRKASHHYVYLLKKNISDVIPYLKDTLKELLQLPTYAGNQIIGDSAAFSEEANQFLLDQLAPLKNFKGIIFYGFTGDGANGMVADLIKKQILKPEKIIANIVANKSLEVINEYQCSYSKEIQNFLIVDDGNGQCQFGDDIYLSDPLAEKLICLEGGVISFGQILNTLIYHEKPDLTIYTGLRNKDNSDLERSLFSASELFLTLKQAIQNNRLENSTQFENILTDYLKYHRLNPENNDDNELKQKQIQAYFENFKQLEETTQQQILDKIKAIRSIDYSQEPAHKKSLDKSKPLIEQPFQFFSTHNNDSKKDNVLSNVTSCKL